MQIIIEVPEDNYKRLMEYDSVIDDFWLEIIKAGKPLPKGHDRLIEASYLLNLLNCEEYESCTWRNCSDCNQEKCITKYDILEAPTIIEKDRLNHRKVRIRNE